jgi:hypothetical protein
VVVGSVSLPSGAAARDWNPDTAAAIDCDDGVTFDRAGGITLDHAG